MQNDHQQMGYKLLGVFLDEQIANAQPNLASLLITYLQDTPWMLFLFWP